jgi:hypothetical protein
MNEAMTLTRKGRQALKSGFNYPTPLHELLMIIADKIGDEVSTANMFSMVQQLVAVFGTPEAAIDAIHRGRIGFAKAN